ncbi:MAG TPA: cation:proton antiporter [Candidatus Limnocylindrales bacterium]
MENSTAVLELGLLLLGAVALGWAARRVGLPAVVGYLALGIAVSPFTPGFVADRHQVALLADLGVVLLLFEVGIEVDLLRLRREQRALLWTAPLQVVATTVIAGAVATAAGVDPVAGATIGLSIALSSSVVIVNITRSSRRTTDRPTEEALLGWSVVQDVTGVAVAAVLLSAVGAGARPLPIALLGTAGLGVAALVVAAVLPRAVAGLRAQHDLFLIASVACGLAVAGIGAVVFGVPLALAAFVGGLAITETPTTAEIRRRLLPFRDLLAVLFFVGIGMLLDPAQLGAAVPWVVLFLVLLVVAKSGVAYVLARVGSLAARPGQLAIGLGQVGEFSFVLASALVAARAISAPVFVALIATVIVSIAASSVLVRLQGRGPKDGLTPGALAPRRR